MRTLSRRWNPNNIPAMFSEHIEPGPPPSPRLRQRNRDQLLHETFRDKYQRRLAALVHNTATMHWRGALKAAALLLRGRRGQLAGLIEPGLAIGALGGFCQTANDLSAEVVLEAYARGMFLQSGLTDASFWAPELRNVIDLTALPATTSHLVASASTFDSNTDYMIARCQAGRRVRYSQAVLHAFAGLADAGAGHSFEFRNAAGVITGGAFGIATGCVFVVHGLFSREKADESRVFDHLLAALKEKSFLIADITPMKDRKHPSARAMTRPDFNFCLKTKRAEISAEQWSKPLRKPEKRQAA